MKLEYAGLSESGPVRPLNEDAVLMCASPDAGLFLVADGVGGRASGEVVSGRIRDAYRQWWQTAFLPSSGKLNFPDALREIQDTLLHVNRELVQQFGQMNAGSTLALLFLYRGNCACISAGDSRAYRIRGFGLKQITQDDAFKFYRDKFHDYTDPLRYTAIAVEGTVTYKALLFIPGAAPYDYYTREFQAGLQLYSNGVLIMDKCADLLGEHFRFVRGVVDSPDLSLNISRELLQHDRQLKVIARNLEKRIKSELVKLREEDREKYETFWKHFGRQIKYGVVAEYGMHKDLLSDLLMFYSSTEKKMVTLAEYADRMSGEQKYIYYAAGDSPEKVDKLPQTELLKEKGSEILYFTEEVDEFCAQILHQYREKEFRSILDQELEEGDKEKAKEAGDAHKAAFDFVKETLGDKIKEVRASARLKSHPVCLTAGEGMSFEMEKYFQSVDRILELNVDHPAFQALENAVTANPDKAKSYTELLYGQALLIAGLPLEDPSAYTDLVCALMR